MSSRISDTGETRRHHQGSGRESFVSAADTRNPFRSAKHGAGSSGVPYLALHPMGFSVPPGSRRERWALTPPFHPYHVTCEHAPGGLFSVALSVRMPHGIAARVYPQVKARGYAASRPMVFGLSSPSKSPRRKRFSAFPKSGRL